MLALLALFGFQVAVLAFPQVLFSNRLQSSSVVVYFDDQAGDEVARMAESVETRLRGSGYYDPSVSHRVFLFGNQPKYAVFARLALVTPRAQGFALSAFGNTYVSGPNVAANAQMTGGRPRYGIREGDPAHIIAHEIGHLYMTHRIGRDVWAELPRWKQEGFPEYVANIALVRSDRAATLPRRIDILNDGRSWNAQQQWDRIHYEAELLVEFLFDVQSATLEDIVADSVTRDGTLAAMLAWREKQAAISGSS